MNKLSMLKGFALASALVLTVTGCNSKKNVTFNKVDAYSYETTYRDMRISGEGYSAEQYTTYTEKREVDGKTKTVKKYEVTDVRALVIPVDFTDYPITDGDDTVVPYGETGFKEELRKVMFGGDGETDWYSLAGYYASSSHGECKVTGDIGPTWHTGVSSKSWDKKDTSHSQTIAVQIQDYYREHYTDIDLSQYDANQDGFVDALIMLYSAPITTTGEVWWAFCWSVSGAYGKYGPATEGINRFFWASTNFFYEKGNNQYYTKSEIETNHIKADAHTMTHEFGHVLGLPDYYITDYAASDYGGLGGLDMMDYNVGDHNSASKAFYGWTEPYLATGSGKITLRSATTTSDCLIVPINGTYKNTLLDQYLMVELITPEGVAKKDGDAKYLGTYPQYYNQAGVRIIQVDARLGLYTYNSAKGEYAFSGFTSSISKGNQTYTGLACSNTASSSCYSTYKLLEVLPATGKSIKSYGNADNTCLYQPGDSFGAASGGVWNNYMMHGVSGAKDVALGMSISFGEYGVDADGNKTIEITVTKL